MQEGNETVNDESDISDKENDENSIITVSSANDNSDSSLTNLNSPNDKTVVECSLSKLNRSLRLSEENNCLNINHPNNFRPSVINFDTESLNKSFSELNQEQKMSKLNIDQMLKIIPEFDGSSNKLNKFITCCEIVYSPLTIKEDQLLFLNILKSKLGEKPFEIIKYKNFESWKELKAELELQFSDTRPVEQLQVELVQLRQHRNESVREFATKVEQLLADLNNACIAREGEAAAQHIKNLNSITALNTFQNGLKEPFRLLVKACRFNKLKDAVSKAVEEEASTTNTSNGYSKFDFNTNSYSHRNTTREKCQLCQRIGHTAKSCFSFKPNQNNNTNNYTNSIPSIPIKFPIPIQNPNYNQSLNRNSQRSSTFESPNNIRTNKCNYCKHLGHTINECRKREFNNRRSANFNKNDNSKFENSGQNTSSSSVNCNQLDQTNAVVRASQI